MMYTTFNANGFRRLHPAFLAFTLLLPGRDAAAQPPTVPQPSLGTPPAQPQQPPSPAHVPRAAAGGTISGVVIDASLGFDVAGQALVRAPLQNLFVGFGAGAVDATQPLGAGTFIGYNAGSNNLDGLGNTLVGWRAGTANDHGMVNTLLGGEAGLSNTSGSENTFVGYTAGPTNVGGSYNSFFGYYAGVGNTSGDHNTAIGYASVFSLQGLSHATVIGAGASVASSNTIMLGRGFADDVVVGNQLTVQSIPLAPSTAQVCFNAQGQLLQCGASSLRWKRDVRPLTTGLDIVMRLEPIRFTWRDDGRQDVGLSAEDVARVAPDLAWTDAEGEPAGVKYDKLNIVLLNAVKEQQQQIRELQAAIAAQQRQIDVLMRRLDGLR